MSMEALTAPVGLAIGEMDTTARVIFSFMLLLFKLIWFNIYTLLENKTTLFNGLS